eukprot:9058478-Lingulodinium_polyedra.AAC.1
MLFHGAPPTLGWQARASCRPLAARGGIPVVGDIRGVGRLRHPHLAGHLLRLGGRTLAMTYRHWCNDSELTC